MPLFQVGHVVQTSRSVLWLAWYVYFSCKGRKLNIYCCELALSSEISRRHLADYGKNCTIKRAARAARLFFLIQPIKSLVYGVVVAVPVVLS